MNRPLTRIYLSNRDYTSLPEIEFVQDEDCDNLFEGLRNGLTLTLSFLIGLNLAFYIF